MVVTQVPQHEEVFRSPAAKHRTEERIVLFGEERL